MKILWRPRHQFDDDRRLRRFAGGFPLAHSREMPIAANILPASAWAGMPAMCRFVRRVPAGKRSPSAGVVRHALPFPPSMPAAPSMWSSLFPPDVVALRGAGLMRDRAPRSADLRVDEGQRGSRGRSFIGSDRIDRLALVGYYKGKLELMGRGRILRIQRPGAIRIERVGSRNSVVRKDFTRKDSRFRDGDLTCDIDCRDPNAVKWRRSREVQGRGRSR